MSALDTNVLVRYHIKLVVNWDWRVPRVTSNNTKQSPIFLQMLKYSKQNFVVPEELSGFAVMRQKG